MLSEVLAASSPVSLPNAAADRTIAQGRFDDPDRELTAASLVRADRRGGDRSQGTKPYGIIWRGPTTTKWVCSSPRTPTRVRSSRSRHGAPSRLVDSRRAGTLSMSWCGRGKGAGRAGCRLPGTVVVTVRAG